MKHHLYYHGIMHVPLNNAQYLENLCLFSVALINREIFQKSENHCQFIFELWFHSIVCHLFTQNKLCSLHSHLFRILASYTYSLLNTISALFLFYPLNQNREQKNILLIIAHWRTYNKLNNIVHYVFCQYGQFLIIFAYLSTPITV